MKMSLKTGIALSLVPQVLFVKWLTNHSQLVEVYYSTSIYPRIATFFRWLLGWAPFSIGDLLYGSLLFFALFYLFKNRKKILNHKLAFLRDCAMVLSVGYFTFYTMWGFNYYRAPLANTLALTESKDFGQLVYFTKQLITKTNSIQLRLAQDSLQSVHIPYTQQELFTKTMEGYQHLAKRHSFLHYQNPSIKTSLLSTALTYMGYAGYLNPFTNEAQVNGLLPNFRFPVVAGHEIGHQLGYAAENETNFIGYLVSTHNKDPYISYVGYAYALGYCLSDVKRGDPNAFNEMLTTIHPGVLANFNEMNAFWKMYQNPMEPVFKEVYNLFLEANNQTEGIMSYNAMVRFLVPYHEKYPL